MEVHLRVIGGKHEGRLLPVLEPEFVIGRDEACHLRPGSKAVAERHCAIVVKEAYVGVRDLGSETGTFVNDVQVEGEVELKNGNRLRIGPLVFEIELTIRVGGPKKPKVESVSEAAARTRGSGGGNRKEDDQLDLFDILGKSDPEDRNWRPQQVKPESEENQPQAGPTGGGLTGLGDKSAQKDSSSDANTRSAAADLLKQIFGEDDKKEE